MAGLGTNNQNVTYVNIRAGKLMVKKDGKETFFDTLEGVITKIVFRIKEWQGRSFEVAEVNVNAVGEAFVLTIGVDSGYFRGFMNSLRSSTKPNEMLTIKPFYKVEADKKTSTVFVIQDGKNMKHFYTKDAMGDFPEIDIVVVKGQKVYDNGKQVQFWKDWIIKTFGVDHEGKKQEIQDELEIPDDLPF
jgi:hypothetical protein